MERPTPLSNALDAMEGDALTTISAFLLLAGVWHRAEFRRSPLVPSDQLEEAGFSSWARVGRGRSKFRFGPLAPQEIFVDEPMASSARLTDADEDENSGARLGRRVAEAEGLSEAIRRAVRSGSREDTAKAVFLGCFSEHELLRTSAYLSALDILALSARDLEYLRYVTHRRLSLRLIGNEVDGQVRDDPFDAPHEIEAALTEVLAGRLGVGDWLSFIDGAPGSGGLPVKAGLMLIHGTVFWGRPTWCVPGNGRLFNYLKSGPRPDVYAMDDYFLWEGSYTIGGYGREVAARNLREWVYSRGLAGIDAVTHSHGGNVLLKATQEGCRFGDVLLLSCPVRKEYSLARRAVRSARSVRIKFDLVLVADRAGQAFPRRSGIEEMVLPIWFHSHSATTKPTTWREYGITI